MPMQSGLELAIRYGNQGRSRKETGSWESFAYSC